MKHFNWQLQTTNDGSYTVYNQLLQVSYHSLHGALQESKHVYIQNGLDYVFKHFSEPLRVLEIGFGTGLNAWLTGLCSYQQQRHLEYHTIEKYPLPESVVVELSHQPFLLEQGLFFMQLHISPWENLNSLTPYFSLQKNNLDFVEFEPRTTYHLVYFDAFAPQTVPDMWTRERFETLYHCLEKGGALVTYCAKGSVKRMLKELSFKVETLAGAPGKREMIRALKA